MNKHRGGWLSGSSQWQHRHWANGRGGVTVLNYPPRLFMRTFTPQKTGTVTVPYPEGSSTIVDYKFYFNHMSNTDTPSVGFVGAGYFKTKDGWSEKLTQAELTEKYAAVIKPLPGTQWLLQLNARQSLGDGRNGFAVAFNLVAAELGYDSIIQLAKKYQWLAPEVYPDAAEPSEDNPMRVWLDSYYDKITYVPSGLVAQQFWMVARNRSTGDYAIQPLPNYSKGAVFAAWGFPPVPDLGWSITAPDGTATNFKDRYFGGFSNELL